MYVSILGDLYSQKKGTMTSTARVKCMYSLGWKVCLFYKQKCRREKWETQHTGSL